jgi:hypothetical protein
LPGRHGERTERRPDAGVDDVPVVFPRIVTGAFMEAWHVGGYSGLEVVDPALARL